jgi:membrane-associated protease RseP (regulator of RpoE activity)
VSSQDISAPPAFAVTRGGRSPLAIAYSARLLWLHVLLLLLTLLTTSAVGARMQFNFDRNLPFFDIDRDLGVFRDIWSNPRLLLSGLPFSLTLLTILMAHECGHYIACLYYRIDASLPYFLPAPTFTGTLGAFIRIRSAIYSKRALFDVGIAGPIAGFIFLLPALSVGLAISKVLPGIATAGSITFGTPPLLRFFELLIFPGVPAADIYLHPVVRAAWVGLLATALNLLPAGQLDGGHIVYAIAGERHKTITRIFLACLLPLGYYYWHGWWVWAVLLFIFGRKHPAIYDEQQLRTPRYQLAFLALAIFLLCFSLAPVNG